MAQTPKTASVVPASAVAAATASPTDAARLMSALTMGSTRAEAGLSRASTADERTSMSG